MAAIKSIMVRIAGGAVRWRRIKITSGERFCVEAYRTDLSWTSGVFSSEETIWNLLTTVGTEREAQRIVDEIESAWSLAANRFFAALPRSSRTMTAQARRACATARVGDTVEFMFGATLVRAKVTEDRGFLGSGGRRILGVRVKMGRDVPPLETEVVEAFVKVVKRRAKRRPKR